MLDPRDLDTPQLLLVAFVVVVALAIGVAASTSSAAFGTYNPTWEGTSELRSIAEGGGDDVQILRATDPYETVDANESVAFVLSPDERYSPQEAGHLRSFVQRGGTLVVAEDFGANSNALLEAVGADARIDGRLVRDERHNFRSPAMPVARNVSTPEAVGGARGLTLNHGTVVEPNGATVLVSTSEFAYLDANRNDAIDSDEQLASYPVLTVEDVGEGQVVVVGDPSVFINAMLDRPGNRASLESLLADHERVLLDFSHVAALPPLRTAVLVLRAEPLLQLVLGSGILGAIALWSRRTVSGRAVLAGLPGPVGDRPRHPDEPPALDREAMVQFVAGRHPDWDRERVERVIQGVITTDDRSEGEER